MRIGLGHARRSFDAGRVLVLGGVKIAGSWGLRGPGDGDVVLRALGDALLGAAGLGGHEDHFPADEDAWADAPGATCIAEVRTKLHVRGLVPGHVDVQVDAARPDLGGARERMRERLVALLGVGDGQVNVKITTGGETPGADGEGEIVARVVASLVRADA